MTLLSSMGGGALTKKTQLFTTSGTFTPSAGLLKAGGRVELDLRGGGGAGGWGYQTTGSAAAGGGSSRWLTEAIVTGATAVIIGAGGAGNGSYSTRGGNGSSSSFGVISCPGGKGGSGVNNSGGFQSGSAPGVGGGPDGMPGYPSTMGGSTTAYGHCAGGNGGGPGGGSGGQEISGVSKLAEPPHPNTGAGGGSCNIGNNATDGSGADGMCLVTWWE